MAEPKYVVDDEGRKCTHRDCGIYKPWSEFYKASGSGAYGYMAQCKSCTTKANNKRKGLRLPPEEGQRCLLDVKKVAWFLKWGLLNKPE